MASFYNNYYRYYRPYPPHVNNKPYPTPNKLPFEDSSSLKDSEQASKHETHETPEVHSRSFNREEKSSSHYSFGPINFKNPFFSDIEDPIFEILGIQLYLDDIIILGLLFFLYQEGVQDEMLFIALILLLLS